MSVQLGKGWFQVGGRKVQDEPGTSCCIRDKKAKYRECQKHLGTNLKRLQLAKEVTILH